MPPVPTPAPFTDADYELIAAAVLETARGRWFLAEHARRNRHADTKLVLEAIERLERSLGPREEVPERDTLRVDLIEMMNAITRTKIEISAINPPNSASHFDQASSELDAIVNATEKATSDIIGAAERIQEIAWTLREQGTDAAVCDLIDAHATEVYTACSFQDITGQRTRKVVDVLRFLEARIDAMINIWKLDDLDPTWPDVSPQEAPQLRGDQTAPGRLQQNGVDDIIGAERKPDIFWKEERAREATDPRNLGEFDLDDLVVFETSPESLQQAEAMLQLSRSEVPVGDDLIVRDRREPIETPVVITPEPAAKEPRVDVAAPQFRKVPVEQPEPPVEPASLGGEVPTEAADAPSLAEHESEPEQARTMVDNSEPSSKEPAEGERKLESLTFTERMALFG